MKHLIKPSRDFDAFGGFKLQYTTPGFQKKELLSQNLLAHYQANNPKSTLGHFNSPNNLQHFQLNFEKPLPHPFNVINIIPGSALGMYDLTVEKQFSFNNKRNKLWMRIYNGMGLKETGLAMLLSFLLINNSNGQYLLTRKQCS